MLVYGRDCRYCNPRSPNTYGDECKDGNQKEASSYINAYARSGVNIRLATILYTC
jgi:hypothetical protein